MGKNKILGSCNDCRLNNKKVNWNFKSKEINFFWEGQSHANIRIFLLLRNILCK